MTYPESIAFRERGRCGHMHREHRPLLLHFLGAARCPAKLDASISMPIIDQIFAISRGWTVMGLFREAKKC